MLWHKTDLNATIIIITIKTIPNLTSNKPLASRQKKYQQCLFSFSLGSFLYPTYKINPQ